MKTNICKICEKEFIPYNNRKLQKYCSKECFIQAQKIYLKKFMKKYREEHKEKERKYKKEYNKKYYQDHKEELRKQHKKYYDNHKDKDKERCKEYYQNHKEELKRKAIEYYSLHKEEIQKNFSRSKEYHRKYAVNRRKIDIDFRLSTYLRNRIWDAIKENRKSKSTAELVGCSVKYLKQHLEKQFIKGMTWDNYGLYGWHIDHIRPCASFDLSKPSEQCKCFHYTNLQPLWAEENLSKNDKY